jgi:hypothetical protein
VLPDRVSGDRCPASRERRDSREAPPLPRRRSSPHCSPLPLPLPRPSASCRRHRRRQPDSHHTHSRRASSSLHSHAGYSRARSTSTTEKFGPLVCPQSCAKAVQIEKLVDRLGASLRSSWRASRVIRCAFSTCPSSSRAMLSNEFGPRVVDCSSPRIARRATVTDVASHARCATTIAVKPSSPKNHVRQGNVINNVAGAARLTGETWTADELDRRARPPFAAGATSTSRALARASAGAAIVCARAHASRRVPTAMLATATATSAREAPQRSGAW